MTEVDFNSSPEREKLEAISSVQRTDHPDVFLEGQLSKKFIYVKLSECGRGGSHIFSPKNRSFRCLFRRETHKKNFKYVALSECFFFFWYFCCFFKFAKNIIMTFQEKRDICQKYWWFWCHYLGRLHWIHDYIPLS